MGLVLRTNKSEINMLYNATYPLKEEIQKLQQKLSEAERLNMELKQQLDLSRQRAENDKKIFAAKEAEYNKRAEILKDQLDRFNAKTYEKAERHDTQNLRYTHMYQNQKNKSVWASFTVSIPFPEKFDRHESGQRAWEFADEYAKELRAKFNKERENLYISNLSQNDQKGWVAKFEQKIFEESGYKQTGGIQLVPVP